MGKGSGCTRGRIGWVKLNPLLVGCGRVRGAASAPVPDSPSLDASPPQAAHPAHIEAACAESNSSAYTAAGGREGGEWGVGGQQEGWGMLTNG